MSDTMKEATPQSLPPGLVDAIVAAAEPYLLAGLSERSTERLCDAIAAVLRDTPAPVPAEPTSPRADVNAALESVDALADARRSPLANRLELTVALKHQIMALAAPVPASPVATPKANTGAGFQGENEKSLAGDDNDLATPEEMAEYRAHYAALASPVSAAAPTALLHKTYDALLDIQKIAGVIVAPSLLRELYEAITAPSVSAAAPEADAWMSRESFGRLTRGGNDSRGTVPIHMKRSNTSCIPVWVGKPPTASSPVNAAPAGEPTDEQLCKLSDMLWEQGHINSLSKGTAVIFARSVLALYTAPAARLRDAEDAQDAARWRALSHVFHIVDKPNVLRASVCIGANWRAWVDGEHSTVTDAIDAYAIDAQRLGREKGADRG